MMWDAVVVGAGPAGAVAARELARRGRRVLLADKAAFPRAKVCGCCLNGAAVRTLERLGLGRVLRGAVPLDRVTVAAGRRRATLRLPGGWALSRTAFDARLVEEAVAAGVQFRPNTTVSLPRSRDAESSERSAGVWLALRSEDSASRLRGGGVAAVTIVASGLGGVAVPEPGSRVGAGVVLPADAPAFYAPGTIHMATGRGGYVGLVRVEDGRLDVAAAFDVAFVRAEGGPGPAAEAILRDVGWPVPDGFATAGWKGTPALTRRPARLAAHRQFVVGDAAGYVEPFTGEGMAWAVTSAAALAPIAARAADRWDDRLAAEWEAVHRRVVGRRQRVCRVVSRVLRSPTLTGLAVRALHLFPAAARPVVAALNRPSPLPRVARA